MTFSEEPQLSCAGLEKVTEHVNHARNSESSYPTSHLLKTYSLSSCTRRPVTVVDMLQVPGKAGVQDGEEALATEWAQRTLHNIVSCFDDTGICMYGCCCPCLRQKDTADKIGENGMLHCIQVCCGGVPHQQHPPRHEDQGEVQPGGQHGDGHRVQLSLPVPRHLPAGQRGRGSRGRRRRRRPLSGKDGYYLSQSQIMRQSLLKVCVSEKFFMVTMRWSDRFEQTIHIRISLLHRIIKLKCWFLYGPNDMQICTTTLFVGNFSFCGREGH